MNRRCGNPKDAAYRHYGGRGITVCDRWRDSFDAFIADMGKRPSRTHSIDRIDNDRGYSPENCRWATRAQQARNKRSSRYLTVGDRTMVAVDWSRETGLSISTITGRLKRGWSPERAISTPVRTKGSRQ